MNDTLHFASQAAADRHVVSEQIESLNKKRRLNAAEKARLLSLQARRSSLTAPIYTLPDHLFSLIFEIGSDEGADVSFSFLVSHVVSRWRRVALQTPRLWSSVEISVPPGKTRSASRWRTMLERSGCCLLDVKVVVVGQMNRTAMSAVGDLLQPLSPRCKSFSLDGSPGNMPRSPEFVPLSFSSNLVSLKICDITFRRAGVLSLQPLLDMLASCTRLENLELEYIAAAEVPAGSAEAIELPALRTLSLIDLGGAYPCHDIFSLIRSTKLKDIGMGRVSLPTPILPTNLENFSSVQFFAAGGEPFTAAFVLGMIVHMPRLTRLALWRLPFQVDAASIPNSLPSNLELLILEICPDISGLRPFLEVIMAQHGRKAGHVFATRLDRLCVKVSRCSGMSEELQDWLLPRVGFLTWSEGLSVLDLI